MTLRIHRGGGATSATPSRARRRITRSTRNVVLFTLGLVWGHLAVFTLYAIVALTVKAVSGQ